MPTRAGVGGWMVGWPDGASGLVALLP